jgi:hypothetical protein
VSAHPRTRGSNRRRDFRSACALATVIAMVLARTATAAAVALGLLATVPAHAATRSLRVASGRALSVTVGVRPGRQVRLNAPGLSARFTIGGSERGTSGRRAAPGRVPHTARLLLVRDSGRTIIALNGQELARTRALTVRLRGLAALRDRFESSSSDPFDKLAQRAAMLHVARRATLAYLGQGVDGQLRYRERSNWSAAFLPGLLWQVAATRRSELFARWAWEATMDLRGVERLDGADVGFMLWRTAVRAHALGCVPGAPLRLTGARCAFLRLLTVEAARRLVERSATNPLGVIPSAADPLACQQCLPSEQRVLVDQLLNLPTLAAASRFTPDPAFAALAARHAAFVAATAQRANGSVYQQVFIDRVSGAVTRRGNFQGFTDESIASRPQAWAIYGFAAAAAETGDPELLRSAQRVAGWWLAHAPAVGLPPYDFSAPPPALSDSSAAAVAGAGMRRLADLCATTGACDGAAYDAAARRAAAALGARLEAGAALGRLGDGAYTVSTIPGWDDDAELVWGLDFLGELLATPPAPRYVLPAAATSATQESRATR